MRTTINLDDGLLDTVKRVAHDRGQSLGEVLEAALQQYLATPRAARDIPAELPVFRGRLGVRPGIDLRNNAGLYDAMYGDDDIETIARIRDECS